MKPITVLKFFCCASLFIGAVSSSQGQTSAIEPEVQMDLVDESSVENNDSLFAVTLVVDLPDTSNVQTLEVNVIDIQSGSIASTKQLDFKDALRLKSGIRAYIKSGKLYVYAGDYRTIFTRYRFECNLIDDKSAIKKKIKKEL